ncbi:MAG: DUF4388 domain-containing protein [Deltaproteobacteria bacterium]|nr:DUF4388 domain-containing protein [Deltaproteobacteria bacterium]
MRGCWAAVALGDVAPELLLGFAAHAQASVRALALRLAMLLDLGKLGQRPERCLGLLSCEESGTRIQAVRALRHYASAPVFEDFVRELLHGGWPYRAGTALTRDETRALAALLSHAAPPLRARAARLLAVRDEPDAARFAHDSRLLLARFAPEAGEARRETDRRAAQERQRALVQLAAAVAHDSRCLPLPLPDPGEPDTLTSPAGGACAVLALHDCAAPLLRLACADPVAEVRREARRGLAALGVDPGRLGSDAGSGRRRLQGLLATSHRAATRLACRPRRGEPPAVPGAACAPPSVATTDVPAEPAPRAEAAEPPLWDPAVELLSEPPPQALTSEPPAPAAGSEPPLWDPAVELLSEPPPPATSEPQVSAASSAPSLRAGAAVLDATALALSAELEPAEQRPPWAPAAQGSHRERSTTLPSERMPYLPSTELSTPRFGCPDAGGRTVRLAGAISTPFAVSEIFTFLAQAGWRGELLLVSGGETRRLFFCLGNIVGAYSTAPDERIGMVMYKLGALSDEQHQLLEQADRAGVRFGWAAVESGFIEDGQLYSLLAEQIRRIVFAAIVLPQGTFFFLDGFDEERIATRHSFNANQLLLEGLTRHDEMVLLRERIPSGRHVPLRVEPAGAPPPELAELYAVIDGRRSVEQIARRLRRGEYECTRDIHALLESGHVAITPGGDGAGEIEEPAR